MIPDSTPIEEAGQALKLSAADRETIVALPGVRTLGDLRAVLERGEVEKALAAKLKKTIKD